MERGTPPPAGAVASLDSFSSSLLDLVVVLLLLDLVHVRLLLHAWGSARGMARAGAACRSGGRCPWTTPETVPRVERGTPPPAGAVASLDSSSSSLLDLVVVVLLLDLDLVHLRLLLHV